MGLENEVGGGHLFLLFATDLLGFGPLHRRRLFQKYKSLKGKTMHWYLFKFPQGLLSPATPLPRPMVATCIHHHFSEESRVLTPGMWYKCSSSATTAHPFFQPVYQHTLYVPVHFYTALTNLKEIICQL